jgi:hypothetical protein
MSAEIRKVQTVAVAADGRTVRIALDTTAGVVDLSVDTLKLGTLLGDLSGALAEARKRDARSVQHLVAATEPARFRVSRVPGEDRLILGFQMVSGLEHHFALARDPARQLQQKLAEALMRPSSKLKRH